MPLPFSLAGRVDVPEESDVDLTTSRLESALESLKPKHMQRTGSHLDFNGGSYIVRRVTRLNLLNIIGSGSLAIEQAADGVTIRYRITFARWFWFVTFTLPLVFGLFAVGVLGPRVTADGRAALQTLAPFVMGAGWLWIFGANVAYVRVRFPRWLRRSAVTSDRRVWLAGA